MRQVATATLQETTPNIKKKKRKEKKTTPNIKKKKKEKKERKKKTTPNIDFRICFPFPGLEKGYLCTQKQFLS